MGEGKVMATGALVAFTALSAGMSIYQGVQQNSAYTEQGINLMKQAQIAKQENEYAVRQKQREIDKAAARQVMAMSRNGLNTSAGSPLEILYETYTLGREEVDALKRQGQAQVWKYSTDANTSFNNGRSALLGGAANALTTIVSTGMGAYARGGGAAASVSSAKSASGVMTGWTPSISGTSATAGYSGTLPSF